MTEERKPFEPVGSRARWRIAYDLVLTKKPRDEITLQELAEALDLEFDFHDREQRALLYNTMWLAKARLEQDKRQTVRTVRKFGWVVLANEENLSETRGRMYKAGRAVGRGARLHTATNRDSLTQGQRQEHDILGASLLRASSLAPRRSRELIELERASKAQRGLEGR